MNSMSLHEPKLTMTDAVNAQFPAPFCPATVVTLCLELSFIKTCLLCTSPAISLTVCGKVRQCLEAWKSAVLFGFICIFSTLY